MRLVHAPGKLRDVELEVRGWRTEDGEVALNCRLIDGSAGTIPARWTDLPRVSVGELPLGVVASPAACGCSVSGWRRCGPFVRPEPQPAAKTEVEMSGQLALQTSEALVAAAVWETLPPERQQEVTVQLARLLARLLEAERDE